MEERLAQLREDFHFTAITKSESSLPDPALRSAALLKFAIEKRRSNDLGLGGE
jgi:hypothetical protein